MTGASRLALTDFVRRNSAALTADIDGEVVALDITRGACYGMDPVATRIWALLESPSTIATVCDTLTALYEVDVETCRRDVLDLLEDLRTADLITVESPPRRRTG